MGLYTEKREILSFFWDFFPKPLVCNKGFEKCNRFYNFECSLYYIYISKTKTLHSELIKMILTLHNSRINQETFFFTSILYSICIINAMVTTKYYLNCIPWRGHRDFPHTSILIDINIHTMENGISIHMLVHDIQSNKLLKNNILGLAIVYKNMQKIYTQTYRQ